MSRLKFLKLENDARAIIFVLIIALLVLLGPHIMNYIFGAGLNSDGSYYSRLGKNVLNGDLFDGLTNRVISPYGLPFVIALFGLVMPLKIASVFLGVILGLLSVYLFFIILRKFKVELILRIVSCVVLVLSPPFLYLFYGFNKYAFPIVLSLLVFYFFIKERRNLFVLSFASVGLFSFGILFLNLFLFFIYTLLIKRKEFRFFLRVLLISLFAFLISYIPIFWKFGLPEIFILDGFFRNFISDLGGKFGLGIFGVLIGATGLVFSWKDKKNYVLFYIGFFVLLLLAIRFSAVIFYFNFLLSFLIAIAFIFLIKRKWESKTIKNLMLIVMICGLLFSSLSYMNRIANIPNKEFVDGLDFLDGKGMVFSSYENGFWITSRENKVVMDEIFWHTKDVGERWRDSEKLFKGSNLENSLEIIDRYDIEYIFIDNKMKTEIWDNKKDGLLFLLDSGRFEKVFDNNVVEIWKVR